MVKATKFLRRQAVKAELAALATGDEQTSRELISLATAYRAQADVLKQKKKKSKRQPASDPLLQMNRK
jgi:hypothetical protein